MHIDFLLKIKSLVFKFPILRGLIGGYPDEARFIAQIDTFKRVVSGYEFSGKCLDAGYGEGLYSHFLESFGQIDHIVNLDYNLPYAIIEKKRYPCSRHNFIKGKLEQLPFTKNVFDCCLCSETLEHIDEDVKAISELARVIKQGGLLLISTPLLSAPLIPGHIRRGYAFKTLTTLLERNGFMIKNYAFCFYIFMKILINFWQYQFFKIGKGKRSLLPRFFIFTMGYLDRYIRIGKPWDLIILAQKSSQSI